MSEDLASTDDYLANLFDDKYTTLDEIRNISVASQRYDSKYIISKDLLMNFLKNLDDDWYILKVSSKFQFAYKTMYFDTKNFDLYNDHKKAKRKRVKIRIRQYSDKERFLELKLKLSQNYTKKIRWPYNVTNSEIELDKFYQDKILSNLIEYKYDLELAKLSVKLSTNYRRITLYNFNTAEKITIDRMFFVERKGLIFNICNHNSILEVKSSKPTNSLQKKFKKIFRQNMPITKYGIGVSLVYPELGKGPWLPTLKALRD